MQFSKAGHARNPSFKYLTAKNTKSTKKIIFSSLYLVFSAIFAFFAVNLLVFNRWFSCIKY